MQIIENERDSRMIAPGMLFKNETSSISINLSSIFHLRGVNLSVGAACACGLQAIALGSLYIQRGLQDTILVGGASEINLLEAACSEAIGDISKQNNSPQTNPKPFHINRDGIVHSGGGAALILEDYEHAVARKAIPLFEVKGYGFSTQSFNISDDFSHMHTMRNALKNAQLEPSSIDYVNSAASGGIKYDLYETTALRSIFSSRKTLIGSTECLTGHAHHMSGVSKTIYTALMMLNHFVAPNTNIKMKTDLMPETHTLNIPTQRIESPIHNAMINGTGLAGMSCSIIIGKL